MSSLSRETVNAVPTAITSRAPALTMNGRGHILGHVETCAPRDQLYQAPLAGEVDAHRASGVEDQLGAVVQADAPLLADLAAKDASFSAPDTDADHAGGGGQGACRPARRDGWALWTLREGWRSTAVATAPAASKTAVTASKAVRWRASSASQA